MKKIDTNDFKVSSKIDIKEQQSTYDLKVDEDEIKKELRKLRKKLGKLQDTMYAHGKYSVLICLQGMDTSGLITHIGGLDAVPEATLNLPHIPGGKKLIYTHLEMPLTAITDFRRMGHKNPLFKDLADICDRHDGLWTVEAEELLLKEG